MSKLKKRNYFEQYLKNQLK